MSVLICPYCKSPLFDSKERTYLCENNHCFDLAKQGYLNLLPVNQKKSKDPGDNQMMIAARRNFLELGFYDPLIESIKDLISDKLSFDLSLIHISELMRLLSISYAVIFMIQRLS